MTRILLISGYFLLGIQGLIAQKSPGSANYRINAPGPPGLTLVFSRTAAPVIDLPGNGHYEMDKEKGRFYTATIKNNRLTGEWQSWYHNKARLDSGYLKAGIPDGTWKVWDSASNLLAIRNYDARQLQRVKEEIKLNHPRNYFFALTALSKTHQQLAMTYLAATHSFENTATPVSPATLENITTANRTGKSYTPVFTECLQQGLYMNFFSNGITRDSGMYKDGLPEGLWLHRNYAEGYYWSGVYKNGVRQYEWKQYSAAGKLLLLIFYNKEGEETGRKKISGYSSSME
jgi:hypothetical protein